ncbi:SpoIIAA-like anti-anti-sigma regulatory factor [Keratinibaculum paraultunense]|uniref:Anti-sigma F factor antagonist n=1 Tax=Keratinibaculum paraultunense TaxID=1278232 RepID=A0A4R3L1Z5_9FIRM|nr:anti-sigma F factor antagonist [Keratinibaculum paraultunense]QQY80500.1 anti-sigma F factor antagonist [Keratinibaculum paraultunense]TCS91221.1 SpoIIAA-like anti-anti-sigma regulatory factor [Keratinibaculum paraultunense]
MRFSMDIEKNYLIVKLEGELDHHTSEEVRKQIDTLYYDNNLLNMVLDLRKLNFMDSSGIGLIMGRYKNCKERGGNIALVSTNSTIDRILKMSGLLKIINVYPSIEEAINV